MKMKKITEKARKLLRAIYMGLGAGAVVLMFQACYGMPSANYTIKGAVFNENTGNPIKGLRVGYYPEVWDDDLYGPPSEKPYYFIDTYFVLTNEKGGFELTSSGFPRENTIFIYIEDVDGEENNLYQPKKTEVDFSDAIHNTIGVGAGSWYEGEYIKIINVKMTEIETE